MPPRKKSTSTNTCECCLPGAQTLGEPRMDPRQHLLSRFYEPLILLRTQSQTRGERIFCLLHREPANLSNCQLRRALIDYLAYTCDYEKGGDTVTAIALERTPQGLVFWISANRNPGRKMTDFLDRTLKKLQDVAQTQKRIRPKRPGYFLKKSFSFPETRLKSTGHAWLGA